MEQILKDINFKIHKVKSILEGLENNNSFHMLIDMFRENSKTIDDTWHLTPVEDYWKIQEMRVTKMAYSHLINTIEHLKFDLSELLREKAELENPDLLEAGY